MGFKRWGSQGAQPVSQNEGQLVSGKDLVTFEVGDGKAVGMAAGKADDSVYRFDIEGIAHPDARLIAAAPELKDAIRALLDEIQETPAIDSHAAGLAFAALAKSEGREA